MATWASCCYCERSLESGCIDTESSSSTPARAPRRCATVRHGCGNTSIQARRGRLRTNHNHARPVAAGIREPHGRTEEWADTITGVWMAPARSSLFKALSDGHRRFTRLAIVADSGTPPPCPERLAALRQFAPAIELIRASDDREIALGVAHSRHPFPLIPPGLLHLAVWWSETPR